MRNSADTPRNLIAVASAATRHRIAHGGRGVAKLSGNDFARTGKRRSKYRESQPTSGEWVATLNGADKHTRWRWQAQHTVTVFGGTGLPPPRQKRPPFWRALLFCVTTTSVGMDTRSRVGMGNRRDRIRMGNRNRSRNNRVNSDDDSNGDGGNNRCSELS